MRTALLLSFSFSLLLGVISLHIPLQCDGNLHVYPLDMPSSIIYAVSAQMAGDQGAIGCVSPIAFVASNFNSKSCAMYLDEANQWNQTVSYPPWESENVYFVGSCESTTSAVGVDIEIEIVPCSKALCDLDLVSLTLQNPVAVLALDETESRYVAVPSTVPFSREGTLRISSSDNKTPFSIAYYVQYGGRPSPQQNVFGNSSVNDVTQFEINIPQPALGQWYIMLHNIGEEAANFVVLWTVDECKAKWGGPNCAQPISELDWSLDYQNLTIPPSGLIMNQAINQDDLVDPVDPAYRSLQFSISTGAETSLQLDFIFGNGQPPFFSLPIGSAEHQDVQIAVTDSVDRWIVRIVPEHQGTPSQPLVAEIWTGNPCPLACSGAGQCDAPLGLCDCENGYVGVACEVELPCPNACYGHGVCHAGNCVCDTSWAGYDCGVNTDTTSEGSGSAIAALLFGGAANAFAWMALVMGAWLLHVAHRPLSSTEGVKVTAASDTAEAVASLRSPLPVSPDAHPLLLASDDGASDEDNDDASEEVRRAG
jgi:hypothetical protein